MELNILHFSLQNLLKQFGCHMILTYSPYSKINLFDNTPGSCKPTN
jgi:hypothetical protein